MGMMIDCTDTTAYWLSLSWRFIGEVMGWSLERA